MPTSAWAWRAGGLEAAHAPRRRSMPTRTWACHPGVPRCWSKVSTARRPEADGMKKLDVWGPALILLASGTFSRAADAPLADASERGDRASVRALLDRHLDVNRPQADG